MKKNICITGLLSGYSEHIAELLAKDLDVFFADVLKMVQFDIVDVSNTIELCGVDYYKELISKKLRELSKFDDVIIFCQYYYLQYSTCKKMFRKNLITVYLDLDEQDFNKKIQKEKLTQLEAKLEKGAYKVRNKFFAKNCDIVIKCSQKDDIEVVELIKNALLLYYSQPSYLVSLYSLSFRKIFN